MAAAVAARLGVDATLLVDRVVSHAEAASRFVDAYRRYCWEVTGPEDLQLAPFQLLAAEGQVLVCHDHLWHLSIADRLHAADPGLFRPTRRVEVDLADADSEGAATAWWVEMTESGGEGMVVKPMTPTISTAKGLVQPGVKVRGREYLRIIYGPEYTDAANLARLRQRGLGHKRSLALREFSLGIEGLDRFVAGEPLYRVHECAFAVLALESDPVDPRL